MRALRNIAIIALIAVPVAFVPGGGQAASAVVAFLVLCFLATLGVAGRTLYRENRLTIDTLADGPRLVLLGSIGVIVLMIAGADEMLATAGGTLLWIVLLAVAVIGIIRVWTEAHSY